MSTPLAGGSGRVLGSAGEEGEGVLEVEGVELGAERPGEALRVAGPAQGLSRVAGDPADGQGGLLRPHLDRLAGGDERHHVGLEALGEGQPAAVGGDLELGGVLARDVRALVLAVEAEGDELALPLVSLPEEIEAVALGAEVGLLPLFGDQYGIAAGNRRAVDPRLDRPGRGADVAPLDLAEDDLLAVGRENGFHVLPRLLDHHATLAAAGGDHAHGAQLVVVPGGVDHLAAVAREGREDLPGVLFGRGRPGQPARRAVGQVADPEMAERLVDHAVPLGGDVHPAQHPGLEALRRHLDGEAHGLGDLPGGADVEGDVGDLAAGDVDAPDLAAGPEDDRLIVRRPGHRGVDAVNRPGLLHVAVETVVDRPGLAGAQVHQVERALAAHAADEGERLAVRRRGGADRASRTGDEALGLAGLAVEALDDEDLAVGVLVVLEDRSRGGVLAVIEVAAVGGEGGLAGVLLVIELLGELQAVAAAAVIEPHLAGAERALSGEVLAGDDVLAVRRPGRAVEQPERLLGDGVDVGAVVVHHPDVVAAPLVAGEGDRLAVRAVARLHLPGDVMGERLGLAAGDRHGVEIAQQIEGDLPAVRADVEAQPGPLGDVDRHLGRGSGGLVDVPLLLFLVGDLLGSALAPLLLLLLQLGRVLLGLPLALLLVLEIFVRRFLLGSRRGGRGRRLLGEP